MYNQYSNSQDDGDKNTHGNYYALPVAIIIAAIFISGAVFYSRGGFDFLKTNTNTAKNEVISGNINNDIEKIRPVDSKDHIFGNTDAPVKIIEYSDFECPFCKSFHQTMKQIMDEYKGSGKVAWVYRHFPIDELHPVKARKEAVASECAAEFGGNDVFWRYADKIFEVTPSNNQLDLNLLPQLAQEIGLNADKFKICLESGRHDKRIEDDYKDAMATGGNGTPWTIVIASNGKKFPINGAQSYFTVKSIISAAIAQQ